MAPSDTDRNDPVNGVPHDTGKPTHAKVPPGEGDRWLRSVVENSSENITIVDPDGILRYASPAFGRMLGHDPGEAVGTMNVLDHVHPDDLPHVLEETERALSVGGVATNKAEYRFRHADGSWRWVESVGTYLLDDPAVGGVVVQTRDVTGRKEVEEALKESERRYRTLVEKVPAITYVHHHKPGGFSGTTYVSPQVETVLGYTPEEYTSDPEFWKTILHPEDRERVLDEDERTGQSREPFELDYRMKTKDWRTVWLRESGTLVRGEDDGTQVWHGVMFDISELKRVERGLREAEERYRTLVERVPPTIYIQRPREGETAAYDTTYISPRVEEVLGYPAQRFVEDPDFWDRVIHPDDLEAVHKEDERTDETGEPFSMEYRVIGKDGRTVWVRDEATLVRDDAGEPLYWLGVQMDTTDRKATEAALRENQERFRRSFEDAAIGMALVGTDGRWLRVNRSLCEIVGYREEELSAKTFQDVTHPDDLQIGLVDLPRLLAGKMRTHRIEKRYLHKDGHVVWVLLTISLVRDEGGEPLYFVTQVQDVTGRKEAQERLREAEERYRMVVEAQTELVCRFLPDLTLTFVNEAYCRYFGKEREELIGGGFLDHVHEGDRAYYQEQLVRLKPQSPTTTVEERVFTPNGVRWQQWTDTAIFDNEGGVVEYQSVGRDVTERREAEERLEHRALHDPLTGLPNRQLLLDRLAHALTRTERRRGKRVAVLFMDLDDFKIVNDSLGHEAGDLLLTLLAQRLRRCLRPEDTLARFGGDEFTVLLEEVEGADEPMQVAERITDELRDPIVLDGRQLYAKASIGIAMGEARTKTPEELLRDADTAMYRAKEEGSGYEVFDPAMYERALDRLEAENDLRRAVERGEFVVHYQPIVGLGDGEVYAVEALVRWGHPERGLLSPDEFVPMAERSGLVVQMGEQVLKEACLKVKEWQDEYPRTPPLVLSVNISANQLSRPDLAETVERVLGETGLEGSALTLDVTETAYVEALEDGGAGLDRLGAMGVRISIDDFGTGYSSLSYLRRLPADALKVDKSFVTGLGRDPEDTALVRMIVELAHTFGMEAVAEGVETEEQATLLEEMGCDFVQGLHFAKPLPPELVPAFLSQ